MKVAHLNHNYTAPKILAKTKVKGKELQAVAMANLLFVHFLMIRLDSQEGQVLDRSLYNFHIDLVVNMHCQETRGSGLNVGLGFARVCG